MSGPILDLSRFDAMLRTALGGLLAPGAETFLDMVAEDAVMEFPYAPPGGTPLVEGRSALAAYLDGLGGLLTIDEVSPARVIAARDGGVVVLEFSARGRGVATGRPYRQSYVSIVTLRGGRIAHYRDYWNPMALADALGAGESA